MSAALGSGSLPDESGALLLQQG